MLNRQVRSPSWMRGSKSRGTAMSMMTAVPPVRFAAIRCQRSAGTIGSGIAGRAQDDVGPRQHVIETLPRCRLAAAGGRDRLRFFRTAVSDHNAFGPQCTKMFQRQLAHLAGAEDEDHLVAEMVEHLPNVIDGRTGDRDMTTRNPRLLADPAGHLSRLLE